MVISGAAGMQSLPIDTGGDHQTVKTIFLFGGLVSVSAFARVFLALNEDEDSEINTYHLSVFASLYSSGVSGILLILHGPRFDSLDAWTICLGWTFTSNAVLCLLCIACFWKMLPAPGDSASSSVWPEITLGPDELTFRTYTTQLDDVETGRLEDCLVCLEGYGQGDIVRELHCKHSFHSACIESWVSSSGKGCPLRCAPNPKASVKEP